MLAIRPPIALFLLLVLGGFAGAQTADDLPAYATADKSGYNLFNPTPRDLRRPFSTDRPTGTENPKTIDAGALAVEVGLVSLDFDNVNDSPTRTQGFDTNIKLGVTNDIDVQVLFAPYAREEFKTDTGETMVNEGFSDITLRVKWNVWGNDVGASALSLLPFIVIPTGTELSTDKVDGGLAIPFLWQFVETVSLGLMLQPEASYLNDRAKYDFEFFHSGVVNWNFIEPLTVYLEYAGRARADGPYSGTLNSGLMFGVTPDLQFDVGLLIGLTSSDTDLSGFVGMSVRF